MNGNIYFLFMMFLGSLFAFLKLFNKTTSYSYFIILGIIFSILEFVVRIPSIDIGLKQLGYSAVFLQIIWISMNFITSSLLSIYIFNEIISIEKIVGMIMILGGVYISSK